MRSNHEVQPIELPNISKVQKNVYKYLCIELSNRLGEGDFLAHFTEENWRNNKIQFRSYSRDVINILGYAADDYAKNVIITGQRLQADSEFQNIATELLDKFFEEINKAGSETAKQSFHRLIKTARTEFKELNAYYDYSELRQKYNISEPSNAETRAGSKEAREEATSSSTYRL